MTSPVKKPSSTKGRRRKPGPKPGTPAHPNSVKHIEDANKEASKVRRMRVAKYDWEYARETFISSDPPIPLKKLAEDLGIPYNYLRQKASEERWQYLRVEEQKRIYKAKRTTHQRKMADESIKFDDNAISTAKMGMALVGTRLAEIAQLQRAQEPAFKQTIQNIRDGVPVSRTDLYSAVRYTELRELAMAGKLFQDMGRAAFGTDIQQLEISGSGEGGGIEHTISVSKELGKDDPQRLAAIVEALERTGFVTVHLEEDKDTIEAEVIETTSPNGRKELTA